MDLHLHRLELAVGELRAAAAGDLAVGDVGDVVLRVALAAGDYFNGANYAFMMYPGLTHGAAMLVDGEIGPNQTLEHRLKDPIIQDLAQKVEVVESDELNELCRLYQQGDPRGRFASIVTIKLKDGQEYTSGMKDGGMNRSAPDWTREVMTEKFNWLAETVMDTAKADEILDMAWHLEEIGSVKELTDKLK